MSSNYTNFVRQSVHIMSINARFSKQDYCVLDYDLELTSTGFGSDASLAIGSGTGWITLSTSTAAGLECDRD